MRRNPSELERHEFEVLVIGGGAFGAAAARDAALRGLKTALIERADFGGGASAECFKMVHGGIRYLQHADVHRLRASCHERSALLRIAPHLVHPLPIAIPTYGRGRRGRAFLGAGAFVYDLLTLGRNAGIRDPQRQIRRTRFLSRAEAIALFPHLETEHDLTGAVVFEDGQMYNPARLVLAYVASAAAAGAVVCNYVEALEFLWKGDAVCGVRARDGLSGSDLEIRAQLVLNAAGPWADYLQRDPARFGKFQRLPFSRDAYFVLDRPPTCEYGIAVQGLSKDKDALLARPTRHLFVVPWRDKTLVGVWHRLFPADPDSARVEPQEVEAWIDELNTVHPALGLSLDEATFACCGLVPFGETATETELSFGKESRIVDHRAAHGVRGLVSLVGIRYTTARADAARALDLLLRQSPRPSPAPAPTHLLPLPGGAIEDFASFEANALREKPAALDPSVLKALLRNHGTDYRAILASAARACDDAGAWTIPGTTTLIAQVRHAVEREMAVRLEDVVMRRTDLAAGVHPGREVLDVVAGDMARVLGWSPGRIQEEIAMTEGTLARHLAREGRAKHSAVSATRPLSAYGAMLANNSLGAMSDRSSAARESLRHP